MVLAGVDDKLGEVALNVRVGDVMECLSGRGRIRSLSNGEITSFRREDCSVHLRNQLLRAHAQRKPYHTVRVVYQVHKAGQGTRASDIHVYSRDTSAAHVKALAMHFIKDFLSWPGVQPAEDVVFFHQLLERASLLTGVTIQLIASTTFGGQKANRIRFASLLPAELGLELAEGLDLETQWLAIGNDMPLQLRWISELLLSASSINGLEVKREHEVEKLAQERRRIKAEQEEKRLEERQAMRQKVLDDLLAKYKANPSGLREEVFLAYVCLSCGKESQGTPGKQVCSCGCIWYVNYCWSCSAKVDDRDPANPHCPVCNWCYCAKCRACSLDGCSTNHYSRNKRWRDEQQSVLQTVSSN